MDAEMLIGSLGMGVSMQNCSRPSNSMTFPTWYTPEVRPLKALMFGRSDPFLLGFGTCSGAIAVKTSRHPKFWSQDLYLDLSPILPLAQR